MGDPSLFLKEERLRRDSFDDQIALKSDGNEREKFTFETVAGVEPRIRVWIMLVGMLLMVRGMVMVMTVERVIGRMPKQT